MGVCRCSHSFTCLLYTSAAYRDLNATLGNFYEQPKNDNAEMDELLERIASLESELERDGYKRQT